MPRYLRYLDTETTGLSAYDEIVELALLDSKGRVLIDTLVRPIRLTNWPEAERIHKISPTMVASAPRLADLLPEVLKHVTGHHLVIYSAAYDLKFFPEEVQKAPAKVSCCMEKFASYYGDWNDYHGNYRWQRLDKAASHVGHTWDGEAHRARADASACRSVWHYLKLSPDAREAHRAKLATR